MMVVSAGPVPMIVLVDVPMIVIVLSVIGMLVIV